MPPLFDPKRLADARCPKVYVPSTGHDPKMAAVDCLSRHDDRLRKEEN